MNNLDVSRDNSQDNVERNPSSNINENVSSNPAVQGSNLPYLQLERSSQSLLKSSMRSEFLAILNDRKMMRESVKANQELERKKIMDQWLANERRAKQKKLKEFLARLSKNQKLLNQGLTQDSINKNIKEHIEKYKQFQKEKIANMKEKFPPNDNNEYTTKRTELIEKEIEQNRENYQRKIKKLEEVQDKRTILLQRRMQLKREAREKRILRAKVKNIIDKALGKTCPRHEQSTERFSEESKLLSRPQKSLDDAFFAKLDDNELRQVFNS